MMTSGASFSTLMTAGPVARALKHTHAASQSYEAPGRPAKALSSVVKRIGGFQRHEHSHQQSEVTKTVRSQTFRKQIVCQIGARLPPSAEEQASQSPPV